MWLNDGRPEDDSDETRWQVQEDTLNRFVAASPSLQQRVIGFAWRHIQCEPLYLPLFRRMLRGIVLVKDVAAARELFAWISTLSMSSSSDLPFEVVVTQQGEVLHSAGWLSGGSGKEGSQQGLLAYERELRELPQQLSDHIALIDQLNETISKIQRMQEGRRAEQSSIDKELQKIVGRVNELNKLLTTTQRDQERLQTELRMAVSVEQQLAAEVVGLEQEVQAAQERVHVHEKSQREMAGLAEELQHEMEERAIIYRRQQDELGKGRTALAVKRQEAKAQQQQLAAKQTQAQDVKAQIEQHRARVKEAEQRQQALQEAVALQHRELEQAAAHEQTLAHELHSVEEQSNEIDRQLMSLEQQTLQLRHTMTELEGVYRRCLLDSQKARDAVESLLAQLQEEMGVSDPKELSGYAARADAQVNGIEEGDATVALASSDPGRLSEEEEAQLRKLRRRVDGLRGRIKALGGCDPDCATTV